MALLNIITAPDPRLTIVASPIDAVDDDIRRLMDDMLNTMYAAPGIGLAAIQIGILKRLVVLSKKNLLKKDHLVRVLSKKLAKRRLQDL